MTSYEFYSKAALLFMVMLKSARIHLKIFISKEAQIKFRVMSRVMNITGLEHTVRSKYIIAHTPIPFCGFTKQML